MVRLWWPKFIRKPRLRLTKPSLRMPGKPSIATMFMLSLIFMLVVFGGGIWDIVNRDKLRSLGASSTNQPVLIYPGLDYQFVIEGIVASVFIFVGFVGFVFMYQSTRHVYRPGYAKILLASGIALMLASYFLMTVMLYAKFPSQ